MIPLFEKYLAGLGEKRGMMLLATILVWVSILVAVFAYALGVGVLLVISVSQSAYTAISAMATGAPLGGDPWAIFLGVVVWVLLLVSIVPIRAARHVWRSYRVQEIAAQKALSATEARLFAAAQRSSNATPARERLARRALDEIETKILGEPQAADLTVEERLINLG